MNLADPNAADPRVTSLDVRVWNMATQRGARGTTYRVRWSVAGKGRSRTFKTRALADTFRSGMVAAMRRGEAFDVATGQPASAIVETPPMVSWYQHACEYVDMKWKFAAGKSRAGMADTLATAMPALLTSTDGAPAQAELRAALYGWAFNTTRRRSTMPADVADTLAWVQRHSLPVAAVANPAVLRRAVDALSCKQDGTPAAGSTYRRKRAVFNNALEYAVELGRVPANPLLRMKRSAPRVPEAVDPHVLVDPRRAEALLAAVAAQGDAGKRLLAFFACLYYAGMRPSEAVDLRASHLTLPQTDDEWGELHLSRSSPAAGRAWTNSGVRRESRQLKHRAIGDVRLVPCHPRLVQLLRSHLAEHGTTPDGRLFRGTRGGPLSEGVYGRIWAIARKAALTPEEAASSMAGRPYDLRHACVTTWLNATGDPAQVAAWAGHSPTVLLRVYVRCVAGRDVIAKQRITEAIAAALEAPERADATPGS
jgi:integrase